MEANLFQVDAFTSRVFSGNPAAVVPLDEWLPEAAMLAIAAENNLAETAFFVPVRPGNNVDYQLRWFTPTVEVDLCGHATLASAHVLFNHLGFDRSAVRFSSKSGALEVKRERGPTGGERFVLDFPARPGERREPPRALTEALGVAPGELHVARDWMAVFDSEDLVRSLKPDFARLSSLETFGVIVTAPGTKSDFVSRFFAPRQGIPEDPATGSSHCTMVPYWAKRLDKDELHGVQVSPRGGEMFCRLRGDRVDIGGRAVTYLEGTIRL
jgi:PhzF family phenazine biosynthesis protein